MVKAKRSTRHKAERRAPARAGAAARGPEVDAAGLGVDDIKRILHDLELHQIELQMQNEELRRAYAALTESRDRLSELYDYSPVGYVTLDEAGTITEANLTAAGMLGVDREALVGARLTRFVVADDQDILYRHRRAVLEHRRAQTCELRLRKADDGEFAARLVTSCRDAADDHPDSCQTVITDITARRVAEEQRGRAELLRRMLAAQEEERHRIGRELHDLLGQEMTAVRMDLERLKAVCPNTPEVSDRIDGIAAGISRLDDQLDAVIREMRPAGLDDLGLPAALSNHAYYWAGRFDIATRVHARGLEHGRLPPDVELLLYRAAQEALTNAARHSRATQVDIVLEYHAGQASLIVEDNGVGFNVRATATTSRLGLRGLGERAEASGGMMEIESTEGVGTSLIVRVPVDRLLGGGR